MEDSIYTAYLQGSLLLSKSGEWFHNGKPFENRKIINVFNRSLVWDEKESSYFIQIGRQRAAFDVEDTAYFVIELIDTEAPWSLRLNDETVDALIPETLKVGDEGQVYCIVKKKHRARFNRTAHQRLMSYALDEKSVSINGVRVRLMREKRD